jgi:uncharacterized protein (DUF433 family)
VIVVLAPGEPMTNILGTRLTVEGFLEKLGAGEPVEQLLTAYSRLTREGVLATIDFGAKALNADVVYRLPAA